MATPKNLEEWLSRLEEIYEEITPEEMAKAYAGNKAAQATIQAWAVEMQAAALFIAQYQGATQTSQDLLVETVNQIIDTVQAILLALGIIYLLKKLKKRRKKVVLDVDISLDTVRSDLGQRTNPRPSNPTEDKDKEAMFLFLRQQWATHFVLTLLQGLRMSAEADGKEFTWRARKDGATCSICRAMDGERSVDGDFLPVLLKKFPAYTPYVPVMWWPHAHPRCRCVAVLD